jgi:hypothetical protein
MADDIITLEEYKTLLGVSATDTRKDTQITALLKAASRAVRQFTDRRFDLGYGASARTFQYDGSGFLEVDDFTSLVSISTDWGYSGGPLYTLSASEYSAQPFRESSDDDPSYYIVINAVPRPYANQMGFTRNLDTLDVVGGPITMTVEATWGWSEIPQDVKLATAWTIEDAITKPSNDDVRSEAIASYSRTYGVTETNKSLAIPSRARDILSNYARAF